jgi:hypothetical protein
VAKAALSLGELPDTSHNVATVDTKMRACVAALHKPLHEYFEIIEEYLAALDDPMELRNAPVWVNGDFVAITKTHYGDYLNFVVVLKGCKTFYLFVPVVVDGKKDEGHPHEASDVISLDCDSLHRPPDYNDRRQAPL